MEGQGGEGQNTSLQAWHIRDPNLGYTGLESRERSSPEVRAGRDLEQCQTSTPITSYKGAKLSPGERKVVSPMSHHSFVVQHSHKPGSMK
jgi:hypothetical protein